MYDAIIIGGRVSGASTAMLLARYGHRVLLLEKERFPKDTLSTHFIWPRGMSYLKRWGLADKVLKAVPYFTHMEVCVEGISVRGSVRIGDLKKRFRTLHGDDHEVTNIYCGPRRFFLDDLLLREAERSGAEVREDFRVEAPLIENGVVVGIQGVGADGRQVTEKAKIVIGADGRFSKFAKHVGSQVFDFREKSTFAYFSYYEGIVKDELAIHKRGRLGTAIFPTMESKHMVLIYGPCAWWREFKQDAENNFLDTYDYCAPDVGELIRSGTRTEKFYGASIMPAFKRQLTGPGWALVGDAGSFKDQVTAMGITHAFRDAELLSHYLHHAFCGDASFADALKDYVQVRANDYDEYFDLVCKTAEMNIYSRDELAFFSALYGNQDQIDKMISNFGDTLPGREFLSQDNVKALFSTAGPKHPCVENYDVFINGYEINPYIESVRLNSNVSAQSMY